MWGVLLLLGAIVTGRQLAFLLGYRVLGFCFVYPVLILFLMLCTLIGLPFKQSVIILSFIFCPVATLLIYHRIKKLGAIREFWLSLYKGIIAHRWLFLFCLIEAVFWFWQRPYLEIPSDPVGVHLFRIGEWLHHPEIPLQAIRTGNLKETTSYLGYVWNSALINTISNQPYFSLSVVQVTNSLLLTLAFYFFSFRFCQNSLLSIMAVLLTQVTMGTEGYSYFRYYTYAPGLLNLVLLLELFTFFPQGNKKIVVSFLTLVIAIVFLVTHQQEFIFLLLWMFAWFATQLFIRDKSILNSCLKKIVWLSILFSGFCYLYYFIKYQNFPANVEVFKLAIFRFANPISFRISGTLNRAILVLLFLGGCFFFIRRRNKMRPLLEKQESLFLLLLVLSPLSMLFFVPFSSLFLMQLPEITIFRFLYAIPFSVFFIANTVGWVNQKLSRGIWVVFGLVCICVFILSYFPPAPGFHFIKAARNQDEFFRWGTDLQDIKNLHIPKEAIVMTDPLTSYVLNFNTGTYSHTCYAWRCILPWNIAIMIADINFINVSRGNALLLVNQDPDFTLSKFPYHWQVNVRDLNVYRAPDYFKWIEELVEVGHFKKIATYGPFQLYASMCFKGWPTLCRNNLAFAEALPDICSLPISCPLLRHRPKPIPTVKRWFLPN